MQNKRTAFLVIVALLISAPFCEGNTRIEARDNLIFFNINTSTITGEMGDNIKYFDKSPFAKLIYGGSLSYDKVFSKRYSLGANIEYLMNRIDIAHSHAFAFSGNYSYYLRGYNKSSTYIKTELGFIQAKAKNVFISSTIDELSTSFIPFYKFGVGTHGIQGNSVAIRFEIFYKKILSNDKEISEIEGYKIDGSLSTIGIAIGFGLSW